MTPFARIAFAAFVLTAAPPAIAQNRAAAAPPALAAAAQAIKELALDPGACYRVRELRLQREDAKFFLTEGVLIFSRPVQGAPIAAIFAADGEAADAELLVMPPLRSERMSLASFTGAPNLEEHFVSSLFLFTDGAAQLLQAELERTAARKDPEFGLLLRERYESTVRNLAESFRVRLVQDLLAGRPEGKGFFYAAIAGRTHGNFDVFIDQRTGPYLTLGQLQQKETGLYFNTWCNFPAKSNRASSRRGQDLFPALYSRYQIEAEIAPNEAAPGGLRLNVTTRLEARIAADPALAREGALAFEISPRMRVSAAWVDGKPAEVFQRESLRATALRGDANELFLVAPDAPLTPGSVHQVEIRHSGDVIREAGNGVYFVGARANWYPQRGLEFSQYEATFRYPAGLSLVSAGEPVEESVAGEWKTSRWKTEQPIRVLGFNLGAFRRERRERAGYRLDVYGNQAVEAALTPPVTVMLPPAIAAGPRSPRRPEFPLITAAPAPSPVSRLEQVSNDLIDTLDFFAQRLGPPPLKQVNVTPIPGRFGQGFPGLLYLSTLTFLDQRTQEAALRGSTSAPFFLEILQAHEIAHQWWGNAVTPRTVEDDWLMEALANYTAMQYLEKKRGPKALDQVLASFRTRLLSTAPDSGKTLESAGPIVWGLRLATAELPAAWQAITYEKGPWILHMLRRRMGDAAFNKLLAELVRRFQSLPISTESFREVAAEFLPPGVKDRKLTAFFDTWVYGSGVPDLSLTFKTQGLALSGVVTQSGVGEEYSTEVPVEVTLRSGKTITHWVTTAHEGAEFTIRVPGPVAKVTLDPGHFVLRR